LKILREILRIKSQKSPVYYLSSQIDLEESEEPLF
jgi:hypothetical protein